MGESVRKQQRKLMASLAKEVGGYSRMAGLWVWVRFSVKARAWFFFRGLIFGFWVWVLVLGFGFWFWVLGFGFGFTVRV